MEIVYDWFVKHKNCYLGCAQFDIHRNLTPNLPMLDSFLALNSGYWHDAFSVYIVTLEMRTAPRYFVFYNPCCDGG